MGEYVPNEQLENQTVGRKYRELLQVVYPRTTVEERKQIRKAFVLATNAHFGVRRKSGEPYIYHPIAVAMICCSEMNLGATSVICALLHDVVEDTDYTLDDMRELFGEAEQRHGLAPFEGPHVRPVEVDDDLARGIHDQLPVVERACDLI